MKAFFIVGTDTGCGKTYVTCQLMQAINNSGKSVRALKPIASGCEDIDGKLVNEDVTNILSADKTAAKQDDICNWLFRPPIAPHIAAQEANVSITANDIVDFCQKPHDVDYLLIESAGGLLVPLNSKETWIDVIKKLRIPVLLVVGMRLGCINHAQLTMAALNSNYIACAGWIANCLDPDMLRLQDNITSLRERLNVPLLSTINYAGGFADSDNCVFAELG